MKNILDQCHQNNIVGAKRNANKSSINFLKAKQLIQPKNIDWPSLPLKLQDAIVGEMVHNCPPDDWLHFAQTSKYSNWLVKRAKPKKIIDDLCIKFREQRFSVGINKMFKEMSEAEVLKLFQTCQINSWLSADDFFGAENKYWTPEFEKACFDSTRCLNSLTISFKKRGEAKCLKFYQNLQCLKILHVTHYVSNVSLLPRLPPAIFIGTPFLHSANDDSPDLLINLAQKTKDFPLSYFCSKIRFAPSDVQQFLQNGVFYGQCSFIFHIDPEEHDSFEEIFTSFGARKSSVSGFRIPALDSDKNVAEFSVLLTY